MTKEATRRTGRSLIHCSAKNYSILFLTVAALLFGSVANAGDITGRLNFTVPDVNGKEITLSDYLGKPIIVLFWGTFCPTCKEEIPDLIRYYNKHKNEVVFLSLALDKKPSEKIIEFAERNGINYPILRGDSKLARTWGVKAIPAAFMIDRKGSIAHRLSGLHVTVDMERKLENITGP